MGFQVGRHGPALSPWRRTVRCLLLAAISSYAARAAAQDSGAGNPPSATDPSATTNSPAASAGPGWHAALGPGGYMLPRYPGARQTRTVPFPFVDAEVAGRWYTSGSDILGVYGYKTNATQLGTALEYDLTSRKSTDDSRLRDLPDVKQTTRLKVFGSQTVQMITVDANVARDIAGGRAGTLGQANLWLTLPLDPTFSVSAGPGLTWSDRQYMQAFFAITPAEAQASLLPAFFARAGLSDAHLNTLAQWQIARRYELGVLACTAHLRGSALQSPIALQHEQTTVTGWLAYRFN
ncbi:MAG TPA: MipA/OmpV family protein [Steroidobacteraceae bacterium]|nr:MipA/OmpV family protein [Steroidobacteraceae bacterium]